VDGPFIGERTVSEVPGIHHVTAISRDPRQTVDFYSRVLGLRLVKRTVNFDDPFTYHLYFGDETGAPGSLVTFFPWPHGSGGRAGPGQVGTVSFSVPVSALGAWLHRLLHHGIRYEGPRKRTGAFGPEQVLAFKDPDGLLLEIVAHPGAGAATGDMIGGLHSVTLWVEDAQETEPTLVNLLGFRLVDSVGDTGIFTAGGETGTQVRLKAVGGFPRGETGVGTVHHVAWRVADPDAQLRLRERIVAAGLMPTGVVDRKYFQSVYFGEPGGILFEIATDSPGFTIDEPPGSLGSRLMLPDHLEPRRHEIESLLPALPL
jgi:catechol 2,3-dioxygenase-like lactoylglutathione lyase family enzyme